LIYINDLPDCCLGFSDIFLFSDDAKLYCYLSNITDSTLLQLGLNSVNDWANRWLLKINTSKCKVVSYGRNIDDSHIYNISTEEQAVTLEHIDHFNDLGVLFDEKLTFRGHVHKKN